RHVQCLDGPGQAMRAWLADEFPGLPKCTDALLEEERVPSGASDQQLAERLERGVASDERIEQFGHTVLRQRLQSNLRVVRVASPGVLPWTPVVDEEEHRRLGLTSDERVEHRLALRVDPVQVLHDKEQRLESALPEPQARDGVDRALTTLDR